GPADPRRPPAVRRPFRLRALEGPARAAGRARGRRGRAGHLAPPEAGQGARRPGARRPGGAVLPARRLRGRPGQRRVHRVLGRGRVRPGPRARPAPDLRRVLREVRRVHPRRPLPRRPGGRPRRAGHRAPAAGRPDLRRPRLGAQRDLHRRRRARRAARGGDRRAARRHRRHLRRWRPARRHGSGRHLLLRPAEGLRRRRRAVGGGDEPGRAGARCRDRGVRPLDPAVPVAGHGRRQLAQGPDLQHPRRRHAVPDGRAGRVDAGARRAGRVRRTHRGLVGPALRLGRVVGVRDAVRGRPRPPLAGGGHGRLHRGGGRGGGRAGAAGQRDRRHGALPQARAQPAAHRDVPGGRAGGRHRAHGVHRLGRHAARRV
ncbi:MAG: Phosphoserine aminotransferase, partial [uncultured Pseudonocardia sp.]